MKRNGLYNGLYVVILFILGILIFYQTIITLILPFRFNIFILFVEIVLFFFFMFRIIWPY